ncbi:MAG: radical SAM protein [bacterium]|nr:radical SAM protein [bacterium]
MKNNRILLINPWIYDFAAYDLWVKPLGLLYLASILRENGYPIYYLDLLDDRAEVSTAKLHLQEFGQKKFRKEVITKPAVYQHIPRRYGRYGISEAQVRSQLNQLPKPDIILITSIMTYWYLGVFRTIELVKEIYPDIPVILGGIYVTICYQHAVELSGADYVIAGVGEGELLRLVDQLTGNQSRFIPDIANFDSYPYPAFDLINPLDYVCLLTTRGCPYRCTYCASHFLNPGFQRRHPEKIMQEIEFWYREYGVKNFVFYDDALTFEPESHFIPLLKLIIAKNLPIYFHTPNGLHTRGITESVARMMYHAGFKTLRLGLESSDPEFQIQSGGKISNPEFESAIKHLHAAGYSPNQIGVYLLTGLPNQRAEEVERSIRYVKSCGARPYLSEYSPIPGTKLWEQAITVSRFDIASDPLYHNNSIFPCQWKGFTWEQLQRLKLLLKQ